MVTFVIHRHRVSINCLRFVTVYADLDPFLYYEEFRKEVNKISFEVRGKVKLD
jgi:hypothetical protein